MNIQNENLFRHSLAGGINLFLGAGFSVCAKGNGKALPVGDDLKDELITHFHRTKPSSLNLSQLCQIISNTQRDALIDFFKQRFTVSEFASEYKNLERAKISAIFTTNIDDLIFKIFADSNKLYINDVLRRGPVISGGNAIDFIALHGCVSHDNGEFDFSPLEISSSFERDRDKWFGYINRIQKTPTLYWGYRIEDAGVLQALSKETISGRKKAESWIVLRSNDEEAIEYYTSLDFQIIISDTDELLKYFGQLPKTKIAGAPKTLLKKNFGEYEIPSLAKVPVRPLSEFYLGAEPTWYDVYSGKIHETAHFNAAKNCIAGKKSVVLIGSAVTGKSTLLKQLATRVSGFGQNIFIEEITPEKAALLIRAIDSEGQLVLAFIDNAADASEAITLLIKSENIKLVVTERDYIFDSVAHRFPSTHFMTLDISGLNAVDTQAVQSHIPLDVRRKPFEKSEDQLRSDADPTFFDVITSTVSGNSLSDRYIEAVRTFKIKKPVEHDLLIVACYCYSCRIPISIDIATAFGRHHGLNAMEISDILQQMSSFLSVYNGLLADTNQSYYVPRSRQVSEVVLHKIPANDLRNMLEIFHSEVSPTKIGRYDIFRRGGYDAKIIGRAFPNWEDGLDFYNRAFFRDSSYSLKQQGALYLASKKNYELAFTWIDEARAMTTHNNAAIRNSYAVILFSANYEKQSNLDVLASLDESMRLLKKCYNEDHRKVYHAKIFADQALRYCKKFPNSPALKEYLDSSAQWLSTELKHRVGDRRMEQLRREVVSALRSIG